ncbi:C-type lectin protein [Xylariaceae sp. FL1272]|nr:C-type lectin protein [Xylariaceae sp. FL1272]
MPSILPSLIETQLSAGAVKKAPQLKGTAAPVDIIDIRQANVESNLKEDIHELLLPQQGPRKLPTLLLYDEAGLKLFEKITYLEEYYLTNAEIQVLERSAADIAEHIPSGYLVIELGSGNLRKISLLLQAFENSGKAIDYYALDLSESELSRTLQLLPAFKHVRCHGLLGTYDDGREWLKSPAVSAKRKCVVHMGSSIGNLSRSEAACFLRGFMDVLQSRDSFLIGVDSCANPSKVYHAYNDEQGVTHDFILNGLQHANRVLRETVFKAGDWKVIGEYVYDDDGGRHRAFVSPLRDAVVLGETIRAHERIQIEESVKFSEEECDRLWGAAGASEASKWMTDDEDYGLHLLMKEDSLSFSLNPTVYARESTPRVSDWEGLWAVWTNVTQQMLPTDELLEKPIKLRNACIFYLGHIPAFLDIQLTKVTKTSPTSPSYYHSIFERGIDPDVDNPEHCHTHSEIPDEWPEVDEILNYQDRVKERLLSLYADGAEHIRRDVARAIWLAFEHEVMHTETLLYMMLQSDKTLPPSHRPTPNFKALAQNAKQSRVENQWFDIPEQDITIGLDDPEGDLEFDGHFGWDNEKPARRVQVHSFKAKGRPITNEEYAEYLFHNKAEKLPASWAIEEAEEALDHTTEVNGNGTHAGLPASYLHGKAVRTVYGLVPLKYALDWPVFTSYDELAGCAAWMGGRIPTFEEARSIYEHVDLMKRKQAEHHLGASVPAVNGHLVNDGVEETPPPSPATFTLVDEDDISASSPARNEIFIDLTGANVGFRHWHPTPVTGHGDRLAGQGEMGGVWEWTSSPLRKHEGFEPMALYPLYTADFFDEKHNIVLGGSWATHPRIAGRKSFVNWYQRNYPYAWVGARLVKDN